jgi:hypothetical protein
VRGEAWSGGQEGDSGDPSPEGISQHRHECRCCVHCNGRQVDAHPGATLVIDAQYAAPEHGQQGETVASIGAIVLEGDHDDCELVDGSIEGWTFQEGAPPGEK